MTGRLHGGAKRGLAVLRRAQTSHFSGVQSAVAFIGSMQAWFCSG